MESAGIRRLRRVEVILREVMKGSYYVGTQQSLPLSNSALFDLMRLKMAWMIGRTPSGMEVWIVNEKAYRRLNAVLVPKEVRKDGRREAA